MEDPLAQLIAFTQASTTTWARCARTVTLITILLWLPVLALSIILTRSSTPTLLLSAITGGTTLTTAGIITNRKPRPR